MKIERPVRRPPPAVDGAVLGAGALVLGVAGKAELDVVAGKLANGVAQVVGQVIGVGIFWLPAAIPLGAVRIDVGHDPPIVSGEERIVGRGSGQVTAETAQRPRAHGLVGVAAAQEADAAIARTESEGTNRSTLSGATDLLSVVRLDRCRVHNRVRPEARVLTHGHSSAPVFPLTSRPISPQSVLSRSLRESLRLALGFGGPTDRLSLPIGSCSAQ